MILHQTKLQKIYLTGYSGLNLQIRYQNAEEYKNRVDSVFRSILALTDTTFLFRIRG
jgi:hypothetical protein